MNNVKIIKDIEECITELQTIYKEINGYINTLVDSWQDDACRVYLDKAEKLTIEYEKTIQELKKIEEILKMSKKKENENE